MFNIFLNNFSNKAIMAITFCLSFSCAFAQYPEIPPALQAKTDSILAKEEIRLGEIWKSNAKILNDEAKHGKPYLPWASYPKDFVWADIPAFPGAEGGGAFTQGGRGGKIFVVTSLEDSGKGTFREACNNPS